MSGPTPAPPPVAPSEALDAALLRGLALAASAEQAGASLALSFGLDLDPIALPEPVRRTADAGAVRAAAPLYLAAELEAARVLPAVEALAGVAASGGLRVSLGPAGGPLYDFWRRRSERFAAEERRAFFARLFGTPGPALAAAGSNGAFPSLLLDLADRLAEAHAARLAYAGADVPLRVAAGRLADNLLPRSGGLASFAARDVVSALREAFAILGSREIQAALGVGSAWDVVRRVASDYLGESPPITAHVERGQAGQEMLAWLADALPTLDDAGRELPDLARVQPAALRWLQASLGLAEQAAPHGAW